MSNELQSLETWTNVLLAKFQPAQRRALNQQIAIALRRSQAQHIASQKSPDGKTYTPRKRGSPSRGKKGRIQRKKAAMFKKIRLTKYLKMQHNENQISLGFFGRVARIARVHQEGLIDRISTKNKVNYHYPSRPLLGFSSADKLLIRNLILKQLESMNR